MVRPGVEDRADGFQL